MLRAIVFSIIILLLSYDKISANTGNHLHISSIMKRAPNFIRFGRNNRPNFIRFGKRNNRGPSFIRFGRSGADETAIKSLKKRPNFIRFGRSNMATGV